MVSRDPLRLSQYLLQESLAAGVVLHNPASAIAVTPATETSSAIVHILSIQGESDGGWTVERSIPCSNLILTAGAWTPKVFRDLFPDSPIRLPISTLAGHSLTLRSPRWSPNALGGDECQAVYISSPAMGFAPEIYSRYSGAEGKHLIYIAGLNSSTLPLPTKATAAVPRGEDLETLKKVAVQLLGMEGEEEDDLKIEKEALCFRPVTESGIPIIAQLPNNKLNKGINIFVAAGHGPWGITMSLGTGKVLSEMVDGKNLGALSADISGLTL
jgi:glycine/D-amino acid oxidase-like deaminating enzyme